MKGDLHLQSQRIRAQTLLQGNQLAEAKVLYQEICEVDPMDADSWLKLGVIAGKLGDATKAEKAIRYAATLRPEHIPTLFNLGIALRDKGCLDEAVAVFRRITEMEPGHTHAYHMLARGLDALGRMEEAVACYRALRELRPGDPSVIASLGISLHSLGRLEEALRCYQDALAVGGPDVNTRDNLAAALCQQGRGEEAIAVYRGTLELQPRNPRALSNLLLALHYVPSQTEEQLFEEHKRWGQLHSARTSQAISPFRNRPEPERRLRIGYVSPDFCEHSVSFFFDPLLENHDRRSFDITCYSASSRIDATTERLRSRSDRWRDIVNLDDRSVVDVIRSDEIDILVDLAGHTGENRLPVFAYRPAPVQVTYLGYPDTTGLPTVDYRLCDGITDPAGGADHCTEELVRLPGCFLCYRPPLQVPPVSDPPVARRGYVTFGSFNNLAKIGEEVIATWAKLLQAVPDSRLVLKSAYLADQSTGERYLALFSQHGINRDRIDVYGRASNIRQHLGMYGHVDVALDTFPYNGTTTTCEALWMGVPVVTLAGRTHAGRVGASLLTAAGLSELVAGNCDEYVSRAAWLVSNPTELTTLRRDLREQLERSSLCDGNQFAATVEQEYRAMWRRWCIDRRSG